MCHVWRRLPPCPENFAEVARKVGVSEATVAGVLNNKPGVSEATRQAVLTALRRPRLRATDEAARRDGPASSVSSFRSWPHRSSRRSPRSWAVRLARRGFTPVLCTRTAGGDHRGGVRRPAALAARLGDRVRRRSLHREVRAARPLPAARRASDARGAHQRGDRGSALPARGLRRRGSRRAGAGSRPLARPRAGGAAARAGGPRPVRTQAPVRAAGARAAGAGRPRPSAWHAARTPWRVARLLPHAC